MVVGLAPSTRRRLAWAGTAVAGALVITLITAGGPRRADTELEQQRSIQDAFPVPKKALKQYLEHTGGSSKLARLNPSIASRIEGQDDWVQHSAKLSNGGKGIQSRLNALHMHQMAEAKVRSDREEALQQLDTGADSWSAQSKAASDSPAPELSVATAADLASMAQAADPNQVQDSTSLQAKVAAGNQAWARLQELHQKSGGKRGRRANRKSWVPPPGSPPMAMPPLIYDTPTAARQQQWESGKASISHQFFEMPGGQVVEEPITAQTVSGPLMASVPGQSAQYFETPDMGAAPVAQTQMGPMMDNVDTSAPQFFETPSGQVVQMAPPQQLQQQQPPRFFETPSGAVVEVENGQMRQVGGAQLAAQQTAQMNVVPTSMSTKLSEDTDDLDGSMGVVHSEPLEDATMAPENQYTVEGTSFPTQVTVMAPNTYLPVNQGQQPTMVAGVPTGYGDVTTPMMAQTQQMAATAAPRQQQERRVGRTQSLYGMGGRDDPLEGVYKVEGTVKPVPCDGPIQHSDTPLCVAKKAMAQALQAEKDVIAAHEKIAQQKDRITRLDQSYHQHYLAMQTKFEALVKSLRQRVADQKRRLLAETRRITTGDNVSLQKVAQARENEMRDWQALNRRLNQLSVTIALVKKKPGPAGAPGASGPTGYPGAPGPQGVGGARGGEGVMGPTGIRGTNGATGSNGHRGPAGNPINMQGYVNPQGAIPLADPSVLSKFEQNVKTMDTLLKRLQKKT